MSNKKYLTFNDGIAEIYTVDNIAESGNKPKDGLSIKYKLRFSYNTIGVKRNYEAMQAQVKLSELVSIPLHRDISSQDVAVIFGKQYKIQQVQHKIDTLPPTSQLSLTRLEADYEFKAI